MWRQSANCRLSIQWAWKTAPWEFQTKLLHYFFTSNTKSNLHSPATEPVFQRIHYARSFISRFGAALPCNHGTLFNKDMEPLNLKGECHETLSQEVTDSHIREHLLFHAFMCTRASWDQTSFDPWWCLHVPLYTLPLHHTTTLAPFHYRECFLKNHPAKILPWAPRESEPITWDSQRAHGVGWIFFPDTNAKTSRTSPVPSPSPPLSTSKRYGLEVLATKFEYPAPKCQDMALDSKDWYQISNK